MGWFFSDYRVSPNFLVVLGLRLWLRLGLGCDNYDDFDKGLGIKIRKLGLGIWIID